MNMMVTMWSLTAPSYKSIVLRTHPQPSPRKIKTSVEGREKNRHPLAEFNCKHSSLWQLSQGWEVFTGGLDEIFLWSILKHFHPQSVSCNRWNDWMLVFDPITSSTISTMNILAFIFLFCSQTKKPLTLLLPGYHGRLGEIEKRRLFNLIGWDWRRTGHCNDRSI